VEWQAVIEVPVSNRYSPRELVARFAKVLNRSAEAVAVPRDEWVGAFVRQVTSADRRSSCGDAGRIQLGLDCVRDTRDGASGRNSCA
jgi:hypothetical protein